MSHKAGFVNIIGNPNVGKSTLSNKLVGERLSIITSKSQTTRHRIFGIVNTPEYQIVFSDTPGVLKPNYKLQESMLKFSQSALTDADILLYITDPYEKPDKNEEFLSKVKKTSVPVIIVINKIDLIDQERLEEIIDYWKKELPDSKLFPISALHDFNIDNLLKQIIEILPESPPFYDKDMLTDKPEKFFIAEIIREKILLHYKKEIPYSVEVEVEEFKETKERVDIRAVIHVTRSSQKGIIIGHQGSALKRVGTEARKDMEQFLQKKVFLQTFVKVSKDWRDKDNQLKQFGYE